MAEPGLGTRIDNLPHMVVFNVAGMIGGNQRVFASSTGVSINAFV